MQVNLKNYFEFAMEGIMSAEGYAQQTILCLALSFASFSPAFASPGQDHPAIPGVSEIILESGKTHEECVIIKRNTSTRYAFIASAPLEFNFHYHDEKINKTSYLFGPKKISQHSDSHKTSPVSRVACFMWVNQSTQGIELEYSHQTTVD